MFAVDHEDCVGKKIDSYAQATGLVKTANRYVGKTFQHDVFCL